MIERRPNGWLTNMYINGGVILGAIDQGAVG